MTTTIFTRPRFKGRQRGVTLVIAMMFMVALTLLGVGMIKATTSEEQMGRNFRDYDRAFAAAEAALRDAEIRIKGSYSQGATPVTYPSAGFTEGACTNGLCVFGGRPDNPSPPIYANSGYTLDGSPAAQLGYVTGTPAIAGVARQPNYYIEAITVTNPGGVPPTMIAYRITSKGYGAISTTQVLLQEVVVY